ncbi:Hypothetical predicted protein [Drosophila guanche]|uniref:Uncharacterized protein n=1 Tax=Drosophila guanche TaxID=7266 RepID=A0A3B0KM11_DROGU|nr:Hypothetical predicted protein [Drosophila guanche]
MWPPLSAESRETAAVHCQYGEPAATVNAQKGEPERKREQCASATATTREEGQGLGLGLGQGQRLVATDWCLVAGGFPVLNSTLPIAGDFVPPTATFQF